MKCAENCIGANINEILELTYSFLSSPRQTGIILGTNFVHCICMLIQKLLGSAQCVHLQSIYFATLIIFVVMHLYFKAVLSTARVATWVAGGGTLSPPIVALCLRVEWSLEEVKDLYLFYENSGDQCDGHCASGQRSETTEFAISRAFLEHTHWDQKRKRL
ncbi:hypothetical protein ACHAW6_002461 [Cyclotella cf. meneghiniana]